MQTRATLMLNLSKNTILRSHHPKTTNKHFFKHVSLRNFIIRYNASKMLYLGV